MVRDVSEQDSTVQFDDGFERANAILGAAKDAGVNSESGQNMCAAAKDLYNIDIERLATAGDYEKAAGLARLVTDKFREAGDEDITDFFDNKTGMLFGKVEDTYDVQITKYKKDGRPDMAAQVAHNAAKVFLNADMPATAERFEELAKSYLEMCSSFYREGANPE